jgi:hypothetical protein
MTRDSPKSATRTVQSASTSRLPVAVISSFLYSHPRPCGFDTSWRLGTPSAQDPESLAVATSTGAAAHCRPHVVHACQTRQQCRVMHICSVLLHH